ncbi:MAG: DNA-processing protein DprA [Patescibacteria group bacterium]|nr:DNA-processing protein DprA [Patescibacteria group bacterium]
MEIIKITFDDPRYPKLLKEIPDFPKELYVWGNVDVLGHELLAMVGTRKPTDYGIKAATHLASSLGMGIGIVSGLAYGIDTIALSESYKNMPAVGVIGSGLDKESFYPKQNWNLAEKIVEAGGVVISEYPVGMKPLKHHFPARNRIIAGLAKALVVIEAGKKSGALITSQLALEYNRDVFALAGSIFDEKSKGTNKLINQGAQIIISVENIFEELDISRQISMGDSVSNLGENQVEDDTERLMLNILSSADYGLELDELAKLAELDTAKVSSTLTVMEIKGLVKKSDSGKYISTVSKVK